MQTETQAAGHARFDREGDWEVKQMFSEADLMLTPEEYAARRGHLWGCFSFHLLRYRDPALGAWIRRLGEILFDPEQHERCQRQYLTPQELAIVRRQEEEGF